MKIFMGIAIAALVCLGAFWLYAEPLQTPSPIPVPALLTSPPEPSPQPAEPTITWSVPQLSQVLFPGTSSTTSVSFQSNEALTDVAVDVTPSLKDIVSVSPATFSSVAAGQNYTLTLNLAAPSTFTERSFGGTIQLRDLGSPPKIYAPPLNVVLGVTFQSITNEALNITFSYPQLPFPSSLNVKSTSFPQVLVLQLQLPTGEIQSMFRIVIFDNSSDLTLGQWFSANIDPTKILTDSNTFTLQTLANGSSALLETGSVPIEYGAPVAPAYVLSRDGRRVATIISSQENPLFLYGYTPSQIDDIILSMALSLNF